MDGDIAALIRQERLVEAAELASVRGLHEEASILFERACRFEFAAEEAARAELWERTLDLLPYRPHVGTDELASNAFEGLRTSPERAIRAAENLTAAGRHAWAGRLLEAALEPTKAASAFERAGMPVKAAEKYEEAGHPREAARVLEGAARKAPDDAPLHLALGRLLLRYGKTEAGVNALQRVSSDAPERAEALVALLAAFTTLGLGDAHRAVEDELSRRRPDMIAEAVDPAAPATLPPAARVLFGRYDILGEIASSPHAHVYEARDRLRSERVAIKVFSAQGAAGREPKELEGFARELRVIGALDHPNIVPVREYLPEGPALVMPWMGGGSLAARLALDLPTPMRAVEIARAVLVALEEAHRLGVLHLNITPAKILFDDAGTARLAGLGGVHLRDESVTLTTNARTGLAATARYTSPEQRQGRPVTTASDVFAVAALLWHMLTGRAPHLSPEGPDAPCPSECHDGLDRRHDDLLRRALLGDASKRPASAGEFRRLLDPLPWPDAIPRIPRAPVVRDDASSDGSELPRLSSSGVDRWLDRPVILVPADQAVLARARAFARTQDTTFQQVLRVDKDTRKLWLESPRGARLSGRLASAQRQRLERALDRLHAQGIAHGHVDDEHLLIDADGRPSLAFTIEAPDDASPAKDLADLARCARAEP